jgi:hypothetical protein
MNEQKYSFFLLFRGFFINNLQFKINSFLHGSIINNCVNFIPEFASDDTKENSQKVCDPSDSFFIILAACSCLLRDEQQKN